MLITKICGQLGIIIIIFPIWIKVKILGATLAKYARARLYRFQSLNPKILLKLFMIYILPIITFSVVSNRLKNFKINSSDSPTTYLGTIINQIFKSINDLHVDPSIILTINFITSYGIDVKQFSNFINRLQPGEQILK